MGGAVTPISRTPAEDTVLLLQRAARDGSPVLIPGAWHGRTSDADPQATFAVQTSTVSDRARLERELEAGGARSQRPQGHRASVLTRLWRSALRLPPQR